MFGKCLFPLGRVESCCIVIQNIPRRTYFLPKSDPTDNQEAKVDVEVEVYSILDRHQDCLEWKMKWVKRKHCWDTDKYSSSSSPFVKLFLELTYWRRGHSRCNHCQLFSEVGRTYSQTFTSSSMEEDFLLQKQVMGPCWMIASNVCVVSSQDSKRASMCEWEVRVSTLDNIHMEWKSKVPLSLPSPKLHVMAIHIELRQDKFVGMALLFQKNVNIECQKGIAPKEVEPVFAMYWKQEKETSLVDVYKWFHEQLIRYDPDVLLGHDVMSQMNWLWKNRPKSFSWSWGRKCILSPTLTRLSTNRFSTLIYQGWTAGRLYCDTFLCGNEFLQGTNYSLTELVSRYLSATLPLFDSLSAQEYMTHLFELAKRCNFLSLTKQLTNVYGNMWSHTLLGGQSKRVDILLSHVFSMQGYMLPNVTQNGPRNGPEKGPQNVQSKRATYQGGHVLEPKVGLYSTLVLLLDFQSLYPSVMMEYNLCLSTLNGPDDGSCKDGLGVLPQLMKQLLEKRKDETEPIRKQVLKLVANSIYGCLGASFSRFYCEKLASNITMRGRQVLQKAVEVTTKLNVGSVIYGDTDSLMLHTTRENVTDVKEIIQLIQDHIHPLFTFIRLGKEKILRNLLLLTKKQYACQVWDEKENTWIKEIKGGEMVRRDTCPLAKIMCNHVLDQILQRSLTKERFDLYVKEMRDRMVKNEIPLSAYILTKRLNKEMAAYTPNTYTHVVVAQRMGGFKRGDYVSFVMCNSGPSHPSELRDHDSLDYKWYMESHILPVLNKLTCPLFETDVKGKTHKSRLSTSNSTSLVLQVTCPTCDELGLLLHTGFECPRFMCRGVQDLTHDQETTFSFSLIESVDSLMHVWQQEYNREWECIRKHKTIQSDRKVDVKIDTKMDFSTPDHPSELKSCPECFATAKRCNGMKWVRQLQELNHLFQIQKVGSQLYKMVHERVQHMLKHNPYASLWLPDFLST
jgi:DNA polymerase alpha subunit A